MVGGLAAEHVLYGTRPAAQPAAGADGTEYPLRRIDSAARMRIASSRPGGGEGDAQERLSALAVTIFAAGLVLAPTGARNRDAATRSEVWHFPGQCTRTSAPMSSTCRGSNQPARGCVAARSLRLGGERVDGARRWRHGGKDRARDKVLLMRTAPLPCFVLLLLGACGDADSNGARKPRRSSFTQGDKGGRRRFTGLGRRTMVKPSPARAAQSSRPGATGVTQ